MSFANDLKKLLFGDPSKAGISADDSPVVPPDSPALLMLMRQVELDFSQAVVRRQQWGNADYILGQAERSRREAIAWKVRRGYPVTQREIIAATTGIANTMGSQGDAIRLALAAEASRTAAPPLAGNSQPAANAPTEQVPDTAEWVAELSRWLAMPANQVLTFLQGQACFADRWYRSDPSYEVVTISWARTALGEDTISREQLPPAIDQWLTTDEFARRASSPAPDAIRTRAWQTDLVMAATPRARPHVLKV